MGVSDTKCTMSGSVNVRVWREWKRVIEWVGEIVWMGECGCVGVWMYVGACVRVRERMEKMCSFVSFEFPSKIKFIHVFFFKAVFPSHLGRLYVRNPPHIYSIWKNLLLSSIFFHSTFQHSHSFSYLLCFSLSVLVCVHALYVSILLFTGTNKCLQCSII